MTPEIWQAKKIVDSTLHPGLHPSVPSQPKLMINTFETNRHRPARLPPLPHVLLRHLEPRCHRRHAEPQHGHNRHPPLADRKPIPQRRDQQRQRQQINPTIHLADDKILSPRRLSLLLRSTRSQRLGAAAQTPQPDDTNHTDPPRPLRRRSQRRRAERLPHARRGDKAGHRRLSRAETRPTSSFRKRRTESRSSLSP